MVKEVPVKWWIHFVEPWGPIKFGKSGKAAWLACFIPIQVNRKLAEQLYSGPWLITTKRSRFSIQIWSYLLIRRSRPFCDTNNIMCFFTISPSDGLRNSYNKNMAVRPCPLVQSLLDLKWEVEKIDKMDVCYYLPSATPPASQRQAIKRVNTNTHNCAQTHTTATSGCGCLSSISPSISSLHPG